MISLHGDIWKNFSSTKSRNSNWPADGKIPLNGSPEGPVIILPNSGLHLKDDAKSIQRLGRK